jgi:hypothetical protein
VIPTFGVQVGIDGDAAWGEAAPAIAHLLADEVYYRRPIVGRRPLTGSEVAEPRRRSA